MVSTRNKKLILAALFALAGLIAPIPASAGGSVTMLITPKGDTAEAIQQGLAIYSLIDQFNKKKKRRNHAKVVQKGHGNAAAIDQQGAGNEGLVVQRGRDHAATVGQYGDNNALGVIQFGKKTNLDFAQIGNGQVGLVLQGGW